MGMDTSKAASPAALTRREMEVLRVVADGSSNKEAAQALYCSRRTVEFHLNQIYRKLNVRNRLQAMRTLASLELLQQQQGAGDDEPTQA